MGRRAAVAAGLLIFCAALAGFLALGVLAQTGQVRVLVADRTIAAGQELSATTADLAAGGVLVHLSEDASADAIPEADYRAVAGAVALVTIPRGALILRHDLALGAGSSLRRLSLAIAALPPGLAAGQRVDLFAVSGPQTSSVAAGANLCGAGSTVGCVAPLAQDVPILAVDPAAHSISIAVPPARVAPWLLIDATEDIWAVSSGVLACPGTEQAISNPAVALRAIRDGSRESCAKPVAGGAGG
ncbi:MAG: SAF domain-containing protein [Candidatus Dormibacteria bacterium]